MSCLLAVYLGFSWLPSVLTGAGFTPAVASSGITAFNLGGVVGAIGGGLAFSRVGSRAAMLVMTAGAIAAAVALSLMTIEPSMARLPLFALLTLSGGLINAVQTTMYALATNVYRARCARPAAAWPSRSAGSAPSSAAMPALGARIPRQRGVLRPDGRGHVRVFRDAEHRAASRAGEPVVTEERGAWRKRHMVDVAVQGLIHAEHEPSHATSFSA